MNRSIFLFLILIQTGFTSSCGHGTPPSDPPASQGSTTTNQQNTQQQAQVQNAPPASQIIPYH